MSFARYETLRDGGVSPLEACKVAREDGMDGVARFRMLREVFHLDFIEAKEIFQISEGAKSLDENQRDLVDAFSEAIEKEEK